MKTLFVVLPFIVKNYTEIAEEIAFSVESMLGVHLQLISEMQSRYGFGVYFELDGENVVEGKEDNATHKQEASRLRNYLNYMLVADYVVFTSDWHEHTECIILHGIAAAYCMQIVEMQMEVPPEAPKYELKSCPFCGSEAEFQQHVMMGSDGKPLHYVQCSKCFVSTPPMKSKEEAQSIWDSRSAEKQK